MEGLQVLFFVISGQKPISMGINGSSTVLYDVEGQD